MRLSEKFYRDLLDTMQEGVFIVAADGLIEYWSRGAETISGYSSAEMRGRHGCEEGNLHLDEAGSPLGDEDCPLTRTLADGLARSADIHQRRRDGSLVPVQVRTGPVHDEEGNRVGAAELFADDTTRKEILGLITEVEDLALLDPLTALPNRVLLGLVDAGAHAQPQALQRAVRRAAGGHRPLQECQRRARAPGGGRDVEGYGADPGRELAQLRRRGPLGWG